MIMEIFKIRFYLRLNLGVFLQAEHTILKVSLLRNFYKITLYEIEFKLSYLEEIKLSKLGLSDIEQPSL